MLIPEIFHKFGFSPKGIIHIGAHECEEIGIYTVYGGCNNIVWIEANPDIKNNIGQKVYNAVISDKSGEDVEFIVTNNIQSSSFLELKDHLTEHPEVVESKRISLKTITLDDFVKEHGIDCNNYDFLAMDIQGAEFHALKGMTETLDKFKYIYMEVNTKELYKDCGLLHDVMKYLYDRNFIMIDIRLTPHGWGDALFIKK